MSAMEADDAVGSSQYAQRPDGTRRLRACKRCKLIKTEDQFVQYACDNCPRPEKGAKAYRQEWTDSHTTPDFEGLVSMMQPDSSWVARWLSMKETDDEGRTLPFKPGLYAISLPGEEAAAAAAGAAGEPESEYEEDGDEGEGAGGSSSADAAARGRDDAADREGGAGEAAFDE